MTPTPCQTAREVSTPVTRIPTPLCRKEVIGVLWATAGCVHVPARCCPSISSLIRDATDEFIRCELAQRPEVAAKLQSAKERGEKVVPIRSVKLEEQT